MDRIKRIWYLSPMRAAKVQASLRIRAVSPEPSLLAHTSSESRGTFRQKARSLAPLNGWACAVKVCHDGMLEDTNSLDRAHIFSIVLQIAWGAKDKVTSEHSAVSYSTGTNYGQWCKLGTRPVITKVITRDCAAWSALGSYKPIKAKGTIKIAWQTIQCQISLLHSAVFDQGLKCLF